MSGTHGTKFAASLFAALGCVLVSSVWFAQRAQTTAEAAPPTLGDKIVDLDAQLRSEPVIYTKVTFGNQEIQPGIFTGPGDREIYPGTPFQADENWLKNLSISLLNRTNKEIVRAELDIDFPDIGDGSASRPMVVYRLRLGQRPEIDSFTSRGQKLPPEPGKQPLSFVSGQTLILYLADYADEIQACAEGGCGGIGIPFAQVTRIAVRRSQFYFADGMSWNVSGWGIPDPQRPGQFKYMQRGRYFPGNPSQNWPPPTQPFEAGQHPAN